MRVPHSPAVAILKYFSGIVQGADLEITVIENWVVCQDHMVGNFNGAVKPMKNAKMMSQDITEN